MIVLQDIFKVQLERLLAIYVQEELTQLQLIRVHVLHAHLDIIITVQDQLQVRVLLLVIRVL